MDLVVSRLYLACASARRRVDSADRGLLAGLGPDEPFILVLVEPPAVDIQLAGGLQRLECAGERMATDATLARQAAQAMAIDVVAKLAQALLDELVRGSRVPAQSFPRRLDKV